MTSRLPPAGTYGVNIPPVLRSLMNAMSWSSDLMFRFGVKVQGRPLVRLTTVGAKTGKERRVILGAFPDGERSDSWLVVASNAGLAKHPGWAFNLTANPDRVTIEAGKEKHAAAAELLDEGERATAWEMIKRVAPGYAAYDTKTDRTIPIFRISAK